MWSLFSSRRRRPSRSRRATCQLRLEPLENRWVPSGFAASAGSLDSSGQVTGAGLGVGTDAAGNVYSVGYVGGTTRADDTDGYVVKRAADGTFMWRQVVQGLDPGGNSFADSADVIAVDPAGNSYVAGTFRATLHLGNFTITSTGILDVFVEKLDTNGNVLWVHQFANVGNFVSGNTFSRSSGLAPKSIAVDSAGNVAVAGIFTGHIDMDPANPGQHFLDYPAPGQTGHPDGYVVKLHADGTFAWDAQVVNVPRDGVGITAVAMDGHSNVYALGTLANDNYFNDATNNNSLQQNANSIVVPTPQGLPNVNSLFLWKLNADGTNAFVRPITSQPDPTDPFAGFTATSARAGIWGLGMAIDAQGNIYATGAFNGKSVDFSPGVAFPGNPTAGPNIVTSPYGNYDAFALKLDSAGNWQWVRQISTTTAGENSGDGLALDSAGNPYITGYLTADSLVGNFLLTPTSAAGNSYIAELSPQGAFLNAAKSTDLSPDGDKAEAIAVDSQGAVDIVGTYAANMQWPGLPALSGTSGGDLFTIKTGLTNPVIAYQLTGTTLHLTATDNQAKHLVMTQDTQLGMRVQLDPSHLVAFQGLTKIVYLGGNGDTAVQFVSPAGATTTPLPDLDLSLGSARNTFDLTAVFSANPFLNAPWVIKIATSGAGSGTPSADTIHTNIIGAVPVNETIRFGNAVNRAIIERHNVGPANLPEQVSVTGGLLENDIRVIYDFNPQPEPPGFVGQPISVMIDGPGTDGIIINWSFQPSSPGSPGNPPVFCIPLNSIIHTTGDTTERLGYHFMEGPEETHGIIAIRAPITLDVAGRNVHLAHIDLDADVPAPGMSMPTVQVFSPAFFHVAGGDGGANLTLNMGVANPTGDPAIGNPDIMPTGSVDAQLVGSTGGDTVGIVIWMSPASTGTVQAVVRGGGGIDDLTLMMYGTDNALLNAVIFGALRDTFHHTDNVRVVE
jgi:hypothetical protein